MQLPSLHLPQFPSTQLFPRDLTTCTVSYPKRAATLVLVLSKGLVSWALSIFLLVSWPQNMRQPLHASYTAWIAPQHSAMHGNSSVIENPQVKACQDSAMSFREMVSRKFCPSQLKGLCPS